MLWRTTCSPFSLALYLAFVFCRSQAQDHPNGPQSHPDAGRRACAELQSQLDDTRIQTSTSSSPDYRNASSGAWNRFNALSEPSCVALPRSASDVQTVMRSIFRHRVHYAVQAGGHSAGAGWSRCVLALPTRRYRGNDNTWQRTRRHPHLIYVHEERLVRCSARCRYITTRGSMGRGSPRFGTLGSGGSRRSNGVCTPLFCSLRVSFTHRHSLLFV